ncbi:MAG: hypothetical protein M3336_03280 [Chloroflexota bacterium]|nr:hypothetical protein [Chloroflexota bacterium]
MVDLGDLIACRQQALLEEAAHERLLALLPRRPGALRRGLAAACYRMADWLDTSRYSQTASSGGESFSREAASA